MKTNASMLLSKQKMLQHILDEQLCYFCVIMTGECSQPLYQQLTAIYKGTLAAAVTHRLAACETIASLARLLRSRLMPFQQTKCHNDPIYSLVICTAAYYRPALRKLLASLSQQLTFTIQVMYLLIDSQDDMEDLLDNICKEEVKRITASCTSNSIKYGYKKEGRLIQNACLQSRMSEMSAVLEINDYLQLAMIRQQQISSKSHLDLPFFPVLPTTAHKITSLSSSLSMLNATRPGDKTGKTNPLRYQQAVDCFHQLLVCFLGPNNVSLQYLKNHPSPLFDDIDWILNNSQIFQLVRKIMSRTTRLEVLGYLNLIFWAFENYRETIKLQPMHLKQCDMYYFLSSSDLQYLGASSNQMFITNSWVFFTNQQPKPPKIGVRFMAKQLQKISKYLIKCTGVQNQHVQFLVWPLSVFQVSAVGNGIQAKWVGNWEDPNVKSLILKEQSLINQGSLQGTWKSTEQKTIFSLNQRVGKCRKGKLGENIRSCVHRRQQVQININKKLQKLKQQAKMGKSYQLGEEVRVYFETGMELAQLYIKAHCYHQSLAVLEQCLIHLPIFYKYEQTISRMRGIILDGGLDEADELAIRLLIQYITGFCYSKCFDVANQHINNLLTLLPQEQTLSPPFLELQRNVMLTKCLMVHQKRLMCENKSVQYNQHLAEQILLYEKIMRLFEGPCLHKVELQLKLIQCKYLLGCYEECQTLLKSCIEMSSEWRPSKTFEVECNLKIIACLAQEKKYDECLKLYQDIMQKLDLIALELSEGTDSDQETQNFLQLNRQVYASYSRLLCQQGRNQESVAVYEEYLSRRTTEQGVLSYHEFLTE